MCLPVEVVKNLIDLAVDRMTEESCKGLLTNYGGDIGVGFDRFRLCYVSDTNDTEAYVTASKWTYVVDSAYALNRLSSKAPLDVYLRSLAIAKSCGAQHYDWMFEAFMHKLFRMPPALQITLCVKPFLSNQIYEEIKLEQRISVESSGESLDKSLNYLREKPSDMKVISYWHPEYPSFPGIDSILWLPGSKTVFYVQITVTQKRTVNCDTLASIHTLVKNRLGTDGWTYKYLVLQPSLDQVNAMKVQVEGSLEDVEICIGYEKHTQ
jgi:hypothetical protein